MKKVTACKQVQVIKIKGEAFEEEVIFESEEVSRIPTVVDERFILLSGDKESAKIYDIEAKEVIDCTL